MQGGTPKPPSATLWGSFINTVPHPPSHREIKALAREYRVTVGRALAAWLDAEKLYANRDDIIDRFLSRLTNLRADDYDGSSKRRMAVLIKILSEMRTLVTG